MRKILSVLCFFCQLSAGAQLQESFADGDLTHNPAWSGNPESFLVNSAGQLQSNGPAVTPSTVLLATPCRAAAGTTWEFYARLNLATSAANYADVFLLSDSAHLQGRNSGYFIRIGGTPDEVSLFRKDGNAIPAYVINGRDGTVGKPTDNIVRVKVNRDIQATWTLWIDLSGTGMQFSEEGRAMDAVYQRSAFMGVLLRYSAANSQRFFFDDFQVTDQVAPVISQLQLVGPRQLQVQFNEPVELPPGPVNQLFRVSNDTGPAVSAEADGRDPGLIHLVFGRDFAPGTSQLTISQVEDLFGNRASGLTAGFTYTPPVVAHFREVRINEILADGDPAVDLPEAEFIELFNSSAKTFDLKNWKYSDATLATAILPAYSLLPGAYLILCRAADTLLFQAYGPVLGLPAFPSLNDGGDVVELFDSQDKRIDRIAYTPAWYQDAGKTNGGWTLELINPATACGNAENFKASVHPAGGTPGQQNSVYDTTPDSQPPGLLRAGVVSEKQIRLFFSEALDSLSALNPEHYVLSPALSVASVSLLAPAFREVVLDLNENLKGRQLYTLRVQQVRDCAGNALSAAEVPLVLPETAAAGEVVINEVLFNPRPGGVDFVELVNRSPKFIDLANWQLANFNPDSTSDQQALTRESFILAPQQYLVLTTRPDVIRQHYINSLEAAFLAMPQLPAYPDEAGTVLLQDPTGMTIDRFDYHQDMHFALLDDRNGVSLERIRLAGDSSQANWHSAASTVGFATPGSRNSQHYEALTGTGTFSIEPKAFTPDGDGDRDFATITYQPEANGNMASITIYDAEGREIRRLVKNQLLARKGFFQWDGLNERGQKAAIGYYVLFIELFQPGGSVKVYKETVALGARF
jgi:hypothetical protein